MTTLTANEIFRDFNTDGVPASGAHKPVKAEIREYLTDRVENSSGASGAFFATRTEMKAANDPASLEIAFLGEGGRSGQFVWLVGDYSDQSAADSEEGVFIASDTVAATIGVWARVYSGVLDVKWFGAVGDGTTDNIAAFEGARDLSIELTAAVYIPEGAYRITDTWYWGILADYMRVTGDGNFKSIIYCDFSTSRPGIVVGDASVYSGYGCTLRDFGVYNTNNMATAINVVRVGGTKILDCVCNGGTAGIVMAGSFGAIIERNIVINATVLGYSLGTGSGNNALVQANAAYNCVIGMNIDAADNIHLTNNEFADNTSGGLFLTNVKALAATGNYIERNGVNLYMGGGGNQAIAFRDGNMFGDDTNPSVIEGVDGFTFENNVNYLATWSINYSTAKNVREANTYDLAGGRSAAFPSTGVTPHKKLAAIVGSSRSLTNNITTAQNLLEAANDTLTVEIGFYRFRSRVALNTGATSHTTAFGIAGTATLSECRYSSLALSSPDLTLGTPQMRRVTSASAAALTAASTEVRTEILIEGTIRVSAAGTIIPQITFSAGPTGTCEVTIGSFFEMEPISSSATAAAVGPWA